METILAEIETVNARRRTERERFMDYELFFQGGQRDAALDALRACTASAENKGDYLELLSDLEQRRIANGRIALSLGQQQIILMGRSPSGS